MKISWLGLMAEVLIGLAGASTCAASTSVEYQVVNGSVESTVVNATATFVTNCTTSCSLELILTNTGSASTIFADSQAITGVTFDIGGGIGGSVTGVNGTGNLVKVSSGTEYTTGVTSYPLSAWTAGTSLNVDLSVFGHGQPNEMILPYSAGISYPDANSSITGKDPSVDGSATFVFSGLTGLTSSSDLSSIISAVDVQFGTNSSSGYVAATREAPEPGTIGFALSGLGLLLAGGHRYRRG